MSHRELSPLLARYPRLIHDPGARASPTNPARAGLLRRAVPPFIPAVHHAYDDDYD